MGGLMEIFQNKQQQEVLARANREEITNSSKRGIMFEMLETPGGLAMKKTAEIYETIRKSAVSQVQKSVKTTWASVSKGFPRQSLEE